MKARTRLSLSPLVLVAALAAGSVRAAEAPRRSRLCPEDLPEGVHLPPPPGCGIDAGKPVPRRSGVYDLGDGTTVRVGGRASAEYGVRR
ncbi:hypothetical protein [Methylobacterium sp. J-070]|uniref:hypothetical protein n=1 Tax=Methylobacterium sp. J-070 TaxID=2836650 RepID=UPI001FB9561B|nr:hypothetical protein [Methylobacterium sp. J-070]MCJ2049052.1 hypothetical protein [Methylobacterium sp. J-070]